MGMIPVENSSSNIADSLIRHLPFWLLAIRKDGKLLFWSESAVHAFALPKVEEIPFVSIYDLLISTTPGEENSLPSAIASIGKSGLITLQVKKRNNGKPPFVFSVILKLIEDEPGVPFIAVYPSEQSAAQTFSEEQLNELRIQGLLDAAPDAIAIVDKEGHITTVNHQFEDMFGFSRKDLLGKFLKSLVPLRFRSRPLFNRDMSFQESKAQSIESGSDLYGLRKNGSEFPIEVSLSPLKVKDRLLIVSAFRDISDRKKNEELRARLASIVDSSIDAIISKNLDGTIRSWNKGAERLFGYIAEEMVGQKIFVLVPPSLYEEELRMLDSLRKGESISNYETVRRCKNGQDIHVAVSISPIRDRTGNVVGASNVARDISIRKRTELALALAREEAEIANRELEAFSYSVAHDLRAPLRGIIGFSQSLLERFSNHIDIEGQRYLQRICTSANYMARLIEDLLKLVSVSQIEIRSVEVDLSDLARKSAERLRELHPDRKVEFVCEEGLLVSGDDYLLGIIFDNLLGNAWKFTHDKEVGRVEFGQELQAGDSVYFIRDNGAGFDMAFSKKLFEVFQRLHKPSEFQGTGIGLATVQRVIRRHGGRIWAESSLGKGATFFFTLNKERQNG